MRFPFPGLGVVFDIDGLGGGYYGAQAWRIFMKRTDPQRLSACILVEGDTNLTLCGGTREFCIGAYGIVDLGHLRSAFEAASDPGLAAPHRRFIEKLALDEQPLPVRGRVDGHGRFVTEKWSRIDHELCKEAGWRYNPEEVGAEIEPGLRQELQEMRRPAWMR